MSRKVLARHLALSVNSVANMELGRRRVEVIDLILIGVALRVGPEVLLRRILKW